MHNDVGRTTAGAGAKRTRCLNATVGGSHSNLNANGHSLTALPGIARQLVWMFLKTVSHWHAIWLSSSQRPSLDAMGSCIVLQSQRKRLYDACMQDFLPPSGVLPNSWEYCSCLWSRFMRASSGT